MNINDGSPISHLPSREQLKTAFVGKSLHEAPSPSAVLDVSKVKQSCKLMLSAVQELQVGFRAHVKTHKTTELTRLQVGEGCEDVRLICSTIFEAESLVSLLQEYQGKGAKVNLLYGVPLGKSHVARLAVIGKILGPDSLTAMIDHPSQLSSLREFKAAAGHAMRVFIKTDSGYHRAGIPPSSTTMLSLLKEIDLAEQAQDVNLLGFYSHNSNSYNGTFPTEAMDMLSHEFLTCAQAASHLSHPRTTPLTISVGASPTALSIQNIQSTSSSEISTTSSATTLLSTLKSLQQDTNLALEIHAGVYPVFDLQQVAASSRLYPCTRQSHSPIALSILSEVVSTYPSRTDVPEALINAGTLALAREPCKSYPGWGILTGWNMTHVPDYDATDPRHRIMVSRVSQEHGILAWQDQQMKKGELPVHYGQRVRVWPNHACITSSGFGWYLIVDGEDDTIVDVWMRWRGW